jgi:hypothetical protein
MLQTLRLSTVMMLLILAALALPLSAGAKGNSVNAKLCQKGGWEELKREDGTRFSNQGDCVSYGARGGTPLQLDPRIEITFRSTSHPDYCLVDVAIRDLEPETNYTVENWIGASGVITSNYGSTSVTTDSSGNANYTPYSFFQHNRYAEARITDIPLSSGPVPISC